MRNLIKKTLFFTAVFAFALMVGVGVTFAEESASNAEEANNKEESREERIEALLERIEELSDLVVDMKEKGELPVVKTDVVTTDTTDTEECEPYLNEYITFGVENNPEEVKKLQRFLNDHMGTDIPVTGFYGEITKGVVNDFQVKYTEAILSPWGTTRPTGQVYKTTTAKINDIMCPTVAVPVPDVSQEAEAIEEEEVEKEGEDVVVDEDVELEEVIEDEELLERELEDEEDGSPLAAASLFRSNGETNYLPILIIIIGLVGLAGALYYAYAPKKQKKGKLIS